MQIYELFRIFHSEHDKRQQLSAMRNSYGDMK